MQSNFSGCIVSVDAANYYSQAIDEFLQSLRYSKCPYYASEILNFDVKDSSGIEIRRAADRVFQVFNTLNISPEKHMYEVYRATSNYAYKDWKLSRLACLYLMIEGDPTDLNTIAQQQNTLLSQMMDDFSRDKYDLILGEK